MINNKFIILILLATLAYGISDILIKVSKWVEGIELILNGNNFGLVYLIIFGVSLVFTLLNKIISSKIMSEYPLSLAQATGIPLVIIFSFFAGIILFDEDYSYVKLLGIIIIIVGVILININAQDDSDKLTKNTPTQS